MNAHKHLCTDISTGHRASEVMHNHITQTQIATPQWQRLEHQFQMQVIWAQ